MRSRIFIMLPAFLFFNYDSYQETPDSFFREITENYEKREGPGMGVYSEKVRFKMTMKDLPVPVSERGRKSLEYYGRLVIHSPEFEKAFSHELKFTRNQVQYNLIFQAVLIPYLQKEFRSGKEILLFCSYGLFDTFSEEHNLFVNEFHIERENKPKAKGPVVRKRVFAFGDYPPNHNFSVDFPPSLFTLFEHKGGLYSVKFDTIFAVFTAQGLKRSCDSKMLCTYAYEDETILKLSESTNELRVVEGPKDGSENIMEAGQVFSFVSENNSRNLEAELEKKGDSPIVINKGVGFNQSAAPVPVVKPGKVEIIQAERGAYGGLVIVAHKNCYKTAYFPLDNIQVKEGDSVEKGRVLGVTARTTVWPRVDGLFYLVLKNACARSPFDEKAERINPEKKWGN